MTTALHSGNKTNTAYHIGTAGFDAPQAAGGLYLVATPIGNLGDISVRALQTLAGCDVIYCEDTRVTVRLLERYGIRKPLRSYHDHNAEKIGADIIAQLQDGKAIALVSDAGTPLISDPGYRLVQDCVAAGLVVTALPGACAAPTALQLSGLPSDRFAFMGFLPDRKAQRVKALEQAKALAMTLIFYESPHRIVDALADVDSVMGVRPVAVARELTKLHEEVLRGTAQEVLATLAGRGSVKGEIVLMIAAVGDQQYVDDATIEAAITHALQALPASKAAAQVAKQFDLARDDIYARILKRKSDEQA